MVTNGLQAADVAAGRFAGEGYAFFRFPNSPTYTFVASAEKPKELKSFSEIGKENGVVVAPFTTSPSLPLLLIRPNVKEVLPIAESPFSAPIAFTHDNVNHRAAYSRSFATCRKRLLDDSLRKVVLSRRLTLNFSEGSVNPVELFHRACRMQPHCYVSLWWTRSSGIWLVATPEVLMQTCADSIGTPASSSPTWHVMALAGTMPWQGSLPQVSAWSEKNRREQECVAAYIRRQLKDLVEIEIQEGPCHSVRAANVVHLLTDFYFRLRQGVSLGAVVGRLHPTPAVCGAPLLTARSVIRIVENTPRRYYAGFSGPVGIDGQTALFVSLRCMELHPSSATLYAGGGLLSDSNENDEWEETCRKLRPMLELFGTDLTHIGD